MKRSKQYLENAKVVDKSKTYSPDEALKVVVDTAKAKFDETVELHVRLGVDGRSADQQVRGVVVLPEGTGKSVKVLVIAKGDKADEAKNAGADIVGDDDIVKKITTENWLDFDVCITTPDMMGTIGRCARILGPKGLMPNPKSGTVTTDVKKAIDDIKKGRVEYRTDSYGNVHAIIGKVSFDADKLVENLDAFVNVIIKSKPSTVKGQYLKNISVAPTMGPGIKIDLSSFDK